jgi:hypothetical protein
MLVISIAINIARPGITAAKKSVDACHHRHTYGNGFFTKVRRPSPAAAIPITKPLLPDKNIGRDNLQNVTNGRHIKV